MTPREARGAGPCALRQSERGGNDAGAPSPQVGIVRGQLGDQPTVQRAEAVVGDGGQVVVERGVTTGEPTRPVRAAPTGEGTSAPLPPARAGIRGAAAGSSDSEGDTPGRSKCRRLPGDDGRGETPRR